MLAIFPLLILGIGIAGFALSRFGDPTQQVLRLLTANLPQGGSGELTSLVESLTRALMEDRTGYTIAGSVFLLWVATRLAGSLRVGLRETFDIGAKRHPVHAKLFDIAAVIVGFVLLTVNVVATIAIASTVGYGGSVLGIREELLSGLDGLVGLAVSFLSIWTLLFLLYRYVPYHRVALRTAFIAATFAAISHESLKYAFSWYVTEVATYRTTLGNLANVAVLFFWIYYESLVFILGGEVAQVANMRKASRVGVEWFEA